MTFLNVRHIIQDDYIQSIPLNDIKAHSFDRNCVCKPFLVDVQGQHFIIHKPFDRRDLLSNQKYNMMFNPYVFWQFYSKN